MMEMRYRAVPEQEVRIELPETNGLHLFGVLRGSLDQPVVIMMHGRPGYGNETQQYLGARYLYERGFSSLRLWMYGPESQTRNLLDCTLATHAADFGAAVDYLRKQGAKTVFAVGHSYGGITILKSTAKLDGAVLWDPTHGGYWLEHPGPDPDFPEKTAGGIRIGLSGAGHILPDKMCKDDEAMGDTTAWAAHKGYPLEVISAGKGAMVHLGAQYVKAADSPKKHVVIAGATHQLDSSDEVLLKVFKETADWFKEI